MTGLSEVWRGSVNTWECDEMGHLNVRFYLAKWCEGFGGLLRMAGLPRAFAAGAGSTALPVDQHIRFHAEARAGAPLAMVAGTVRVEEAQAVLFHELRHGDGRTAATFVTRVAHAEARSGRLFPWSARTRAALVAMLCEIPPHAAPRSIDATRPPGEASLARADELGVPVAGRAMVLPQDVDARGRMRPELFIGRVSDSVPNIVSAWRAEGEQRPNVGGAVLEYRLVYRRWPEAGDFLEIRSAVVAAEGKTQRLAHWILDPVSGEPWATAEAVGVTFDLTTRKAIIPSEATRAAILARAAPSMTI